MADIHGDSPTRPKHTHSAEYRSTRVADSRATLTLDIPAVPEVTLDSLMNAVLPNIPSEDLRKVYDRLTSSKCIVISDSGSPRWDCLGVSPADSGTGETRVFKFLETIAQNVAEHSGISQSGVKLIVAGNTTPLGNRRNTSRPDGYFYRGTIIRGQVEWKNIVMPMEFKKTDTPEKRQDDFAKVVWSMHHTMRNDPCRRYVHGLTCENTKARLWYNDRSDVVVSKEFDVNDDWKYLVRVILSILLAKPVELGYDEDMKEARSSVSLEPSYDITVRNPDTGKTTVYRTMGIISDVGADSMVGRGTRVWRVRKLVNGIPEGPEYALKDVWVYEDRATEHEIIQQICSEQPGYSQYFLTPIDYGYVPLDPATPLIPDNTHRVLGRSRDLELTGNGQLLRFVPVRVTLGATPTTRSSNQTTPSASRDSTGRSDDVQETPPQGFLDANYLSQHPRLHYRFVSEEIGEAVHDLRKFTKVFLAVRGGWEGLHAIHLCIHVHRDVSSGNIMLVPPSPEKNWPERGVIMDLEYSKRVGHQAPPYGVKTGTVAFMATEVLLMRHQRLYQVLSDRGLKAGQILLPPFRHNPLHDMESIWWLCLWMMHYLVPSSSGVDPQGQAHEFREIFSEKMKVIIVTAPGYLGFYANHLKNLPRFLEIMIQWLTKLNGSYSKSYAQHDTATDPPAWLRVQPSTVNDAYADGKEFLEDLSNASVDLSDCATLSEMMQRQQEALMETPPARTHIVPRCVAVRPQAKKK